VSHTLQLQGSPRAPFASRTKVHHIGFFSSAFSSSHINCSSAGGRPRIYINHKSLQVQSSRGSICGGNYFSSVQNAFILLRSWRKKFWPNVWLKILGEIVSKKMLCEQVGDIFGVLAKGNSRNVPENRLRSASFGIGFSLAGYLVSARACVAHTLSAPHLETLGTH
jgi:hypothetical protein